MNHPILSVNDFLEAAGQTTWDFNPRQVALYTALQCEELAEKMEVIFGAHDPWFLALDEMSKSLKAGRYDDRFTRLTREQRKDLLDADLDQAWVSFGAAMSVGARVLDAWDHLTDSNMGKVDPTTGKMERDENGKVKKPAGWRPPDFAQFIV